MNATDKAILDWREARAARLALDKEASAAKDRETALRDWIIDALQGSNSEGEVVDGRVTSIQVTEIPIVEDRAAVERYILENQAIDLLQFRVSASALRERTDVGVTVPGTHWGQSLNLSDRKLRS